MEAELEIENSAEDSSETIIFVENADSNSLESSNYIFLFFSKISVFSKQKFQPTN